jgi:hypothetical protein
MLLTDWRRFLPASRSQICAHRRVSGSRRKRARANGAADISSQTESLEQRMMLSAADILLTDVSGASGFQQFGALQGDNFGNSVRAAGDVNGDGFDDVIVGAYYHNGGAGSSNSGIAYVLFGKSSGFPNTNGLLDPDRVDLNNPLSATEGFKILGVSQSDTGTSVSGAGDINGDGFDDLVIAAPNYSLPSSMSGYALGSSYVVFGKAVNTDVNLSSLDAGASDTVGFRLTGFVSTRTKATDSVATGGDINGDGYDDIVIGGPFTAVAPLGAVGAAYVVFGKENGFSNMDISGINGSNGFVFANTSDYSSTGAHIGAAVSIGGDINGDGIDDLVVGAPQIGIYRASEEYDGEVYVVFGRTNFAGILNASHQVQASTLDGVIGFTATGLVGEQARTGHSLSSGGDINGDGIDDLIIGAPGDGYGYGSAAGRAYVVFGKTNLGSADTLELTSLAGSNGFVLDGGEELVLAGSSVSIAGDINGDGFDDIVVGAPTYTSELHPYNNGAAYVIFGDSNINVPADLDALNGVNGFALFGTGGGYAGTTVAIAGDINGDGFDDLLVAEPPSDNNGTVTFFFGKDFGLRDGNGANGELNPSSPSIRQVNGSADGTLTAGQGTAADILIGGGGDDTLTSDGGSDILIGGEGDDVLTAVFGNFAGGAVVPRFDGGTGVDTLTGEISFVNQTIDLTTVLGNRINDIEVIDLEDSATETLVLDFATVLAITGAGPTTASTSVFATNDAHTLTILRDADDVINGIADGVNGWVKGSNETIDGDTFEVFTQAGATVKIQAPVNITGNIDGDGDFDPNDSFLVNIVLLGASDATINNSKGASPLTATQIRTNIAVLQASGQLDVDGDGDSESNDSFLINIIKLGASDATINSSKGASPLTATQIRANVTALTPPAARPQSPLQAPSDEPQEEKPEFAAFVLPPPANAKQTQTSQTPSGDSQDEEEEFAAFVLSPPDNQEETLTSDGSGSPETTQQSEAQPVSTENDTIPDDAFEAVQLDVTLDLLT